VETTHATWESMLAALLRIDMRGWAVELELS
jgi:hypothetical protein